MKRAQLSVEFFLVAAFLVALAAALLSTAETQLGEVDALQKAVVGRAAADQVASWINLVSLQGNYSQITGNVFIPQGSVCLILDKASDGAYLTCDVHPSLKQRVSSRPLYSSSVSFSSECPPASTRTGWFRITVINNAGIVEVQCTKI